jgi:hypothetical protein
MSYGDPAPEVEATPPAGTEGEAVNPPLPDGGPSDGNDESATDQVPGEH